MPDAYVYGLHHAGDRYAHILGETDLGLCGRPITLQPVDPADIGGRTQHCPSCEMYAQAARFTRLPGFTLPAHPDYPDAAPYA